jgi:hypothetical protein
MSNWFKRRLTDQAYWWTPGAMDAWGRPSGWLAYVVICRWEERRERFISRTGEDTVSSAIVWLCTEIAEGDYLYHNPDLIALPETVTNGIVADYAANPPSPPGADPTLVTGAFIIRRREKTESILRRAGDVIVRKALL